MTKTAQPVWGKRMGRGPDERALAYCAGRDVVGRPAADESLIPYDLWTNRAHALMLARTGLIESGAGAKLLRALDRVGRKALKGEFALDRSLEDVHINIETAVSAIAGQSAGGRLHTARSRNDQSATDMRLWMRDACLALRHDVIALISVLLRESKKGAKTVIPGYTHAQPAALTTWGHWLQSWAQALLRDADRLAGAYRRINQSPLGAAAAFGATWDIDRAATARWLGFDSVQVNTLDCISSRWELEADLGQAASFVMTRLSQIGQDLLAFSTPPGNFIRLDDAFTTGSSIMPQKRNPDFAEVTRGRAASVAGLCHTLFEVARGSRSGYNRDTQWTKYWIMDLMNEVGAAPRVFADVLASVRFNHPTRRLMISQGFMNAVDVADHIAQTRGCDFRSCYHVLAETVRLSADKGAIDFDILNEQIVAGRLGDPLSPEEAARLADPASAVARRRGMGAPSSEALATSHEALKSGLREAQAAAKADERSIARARARLDRDIARFLDAR